MSHFDDLPKRDRNQVIEEKAETAFRQRLSESGVFAVQLTDHKDYGTDFQIEVMEGGQATNVRVHAQLKGTERPLNADGSVSITVDRTNLNYLLVHPHSFYACLHLPTGKLRICFAENVLRQYEHGGKNWTTQQTLTVTFSDELTVDRLKSLAALACSGARLSRARRTEQSSAQARDVPDVLKRTVVDVQVPEDLARAAEILAQLYEEGADDMISAAFDKFAAVLGPTSDRMGTCYMAEINLAMMGRCLSPQRIEDGIAHFMSALGTGRFQVGSLHYTIGNAYSALGREEDAKAAFETALTDQTFASTPGLAARCYKNLGSSLERLGDEDKAADYYREALRLNPELPEARHALGSYLHRKGRYDEALGHFDRVVFPRDRLGKNAAVAGARVNILFNLGDSQGAFREINGLLGHADSTPWIWPSCARQVASFGRLSPENASAALAFWQRYIAAHPDHSAARRELLLTQLYLRTKQKLDKDFAAFRDEFETHIAHVDGDDAALPWDRLGHWAQEEENWAEAERCFRQAYALKGGHYGYCLGTALNFLGRFEESLPVLLQQAETLQPDAMSWFQVGIAYAELGQTEQAINAYGTALDLKPDYDLALFNLGGEHWNRGEIAEARETWERAIALYPEHELAARIRALPLDL